MPSHNPRAALQTHDVTNQPPPFVDVNAFANDAALIDAIERNGGAAHANRLSDFGDRVGSAEAQEWADQANRNPPKLKSFDRYGHRLDEVEFHPAYHMLMDLGLSGGVAAAAWRTDIAGHVLHSGLLFLMGQADGGVCCPMSMTYAAVPALRHAPDVAETWVPRATTEDYDARFLPAEMKRAATIGMAMTEKQGGSDVRANTTRAEQTTDGWALTGHKWFCSAPMCDAFLTLAQTEEGVTCFLVPRWKPDGSRNAIHIMRLKDKLGDRSNASSEIEYHGAYAIKLGQQGKGVRTIIDMVQHTRLDCVVGSAGGMRVALANALWHTEHRRAFQKKLIDQPAMQRVLADLILESEGATALAFRLARAFDRAGEDEAEAGFMRLATPIAKYWICKRQPGFVYEALECHGGAGFVEESTMPRYFRASPLNAIWEGSGNVIALDILRAVQRDPQTLEAVVSDVVKARGRNAKFDAHAKRLMGWLDPGALNEGTARAFAEDMGLALAGAALADSTENGGAPEFVFDGYCAARLDPDTRGYGYGASDALVDEHSLIMRAAPF
ncbi:MAG: DNA alkylation response protein [Alphaproteobacteria bacterium]|nr:DNA alkylation response protein [Alphaproteobacteria bacterium]